MEIETSLSEPYSGKPLYLKRLVLSQFKSHPQLDCAFSPGVNFIVGPNGSGKTNILEAISYLCVGKSAFHAHDRFTANLAQSEDPYYSAVGWFSLDEDHTDKITVSQYNGSKKTIKRNEKVYSSFSDHVGQYPMVIISPDDVYLIRDGAEERRRFFDAILCQLSKPYLKALIGYNHLLAQRNALLKQYPEQPNIELITTYHQPMGDLGDLLFAARLEFVEKFLPKHHFYYKHLSNDNEIPTITYKSQYSPNSSLNAMLDANLRLDIDSGRTSVGPHKDDYEFCLNNQALKQYGSQGQQKSYLVALKLAQFQILETSKQIKPIFLLDDIFDKLDINRIQALLQLISSNSFGQIFITDAQRLRCEQWLPNISSEVNFIELPIQ